MTATPATPTTPETPETSVTSETPETGDLVAQPPPEPPARRTRTPWWLLAIAVVVALVPHAWMARGATGPVWMDDEVGYLVNAAFLAGLDPASLSSLGYWGGWSLSLIPLHLLGLPPESVYAGAVAISALYGALLVLPAHALARSLGAGRGAALVTALVIAVVPDRTVMSNYALAENALVLTAMVAAACVARGAVTSGRPRAAAWFVAGAVASVLTFLIHARAAMLVGAAFLVGLGLLARRGYRWAGAVVCAVSAGGGVAVYAFNSWLVASVYADGAGAREDDLLALVRELDPAALLMPASGQAWYQLVAWGGLSLAGFAVVLAGVLVGIRRFDLAFLRDLYLLSAAGTTLLLSLTAVLGPIGRGTTRLDFFFYGRYITHLTAVLAVVGMVWLLTRARWWQLPALVGVAVGLSAVFLPRGGTYGDSERAFPPINVPGATVLPWPALTDAPERPVLWLSLIGVVVPLVVMALRRWPWTVAVVLVPASLVGTAAAATFTVDRFDAPFREAAVPLRHTLSQLDESGLVVMGATPFHRNGYVFWSDTPVRVPGRTEPLALADDEAVIAPDPDPRLAETGLRIVTCDRTAGLCLYVPPGPLTGQARAQGLLALPEGVPLPRPARSAELAVTSTRALPGAEGTEVRVAVRHTGRGVSWPALGARIDPEGVVRVLAVWDGGTALADLPRTLAPGEEVTVSLELPDLPQDTAVEVRLLVEGRPDLQFEGGTVDLVDREPSPTSWGWVRPTPTTSETRSDG